MKEGPPPVTESAVVEREARIEPAAELQTVSGLFERLNRRQALLAERADLVARIAALRTAQPVAVEPPGRIGAQVLERWLAEDRLSQSKDEPAPESHEGVIGVTWAESSLAHEEHLDRNEDASFVAADGHAAGVFDGIGGHRGGQAAALIVRDTVRAALENVRQSDDLSKIQEAMLRSFVAAQNAVRERSRLDIGYGGMGTTAAAVYLRRDPTRDGYQAIIGHVGDSRVYVLRADGQLEQTTKDHTMAQTLIQANSLPNDIEQDYRKIDDLSQVTNPVRRAEIENYWSTGFVLTRSINAQDTKTVHIDLSTVNLAAGDRVILTSDGVHDNLSNDQIQQIVADKATVREAADSLTRSAQEYSRKGQYSSKPDDMTAVVLAVGVPTNAPTNPEIPFVSREPALESPVPAVNFRDVPPPPALASPPRAPEVPAAPPSVEPVVSVPPPAPPNSPNQPPTLARESVVPVSAELPPVPPVDRVRTLLDQLDLMDAEDEAAQ